MLRLNTASMRRIIDIMELMEEFNTTEGPTAQGFDLDCDGLATITLRFSDDGTLYAEIRNIHATRNNPPPPNPIT